MSVQAVKLENLKLSYPAEDLKLSVISVIDIGVHERELASEPDDDLPETLTTGDVWISRGRACRLELYLSFDGKPLETSTRLRILESLGYHLRDAHLWSQLSLSTSLDIPQGALDQSQPDILLFLNNATMLPTPKPLPRGWMLNDVDITPPEAVICAQFEKLQLKLDFRQVQKKGRRTNKRIRSDPPEQVLDDMLLDEALESEKSQSLAGIFAQPESTLKTSPKASAAAKMISGGISTATVQTDGRRTRFPKHITDALTTWFREHAKNTYPTKWERQALLKETGLTSAQLTSWLKNRRKRKDSVQKPSKDGNAKLFSLNNMLPAARRNSQTNPDNHQGTMLLDYAESKVTPEYSDEEDILLLDPNHKEQLPPSQSVIASYDAPLAEESSQNSEDDMLFSQLTDTAPSLVSHTSAETIFSASSRKRLQLEECEDLPVSTALPNLNSASVCKLVQSAFKILLNGSLSQSYKKNNGVNAQATSSARTLPSLAPAVFSPEYKELMAHNSKFLPTISNSICSSWARNVQGKGLRVKLLDLSNMHVLRPADAVRDLPRGSVERLTAVVQGRIWSLMQRTIFDPSSSKKLRWDDSDAGAAIEDDEEEEFDLLQEKESDQSPTLNRRQSGVESYMDEEEELLFSELWKEGTPESDDGLLSYFEEQERKAVELETDEMLFGDEKVDKEDELLLHDEESVDGNEQMLF